MTRYSHTKLDVARQCMLKFKYQYIDKIKVEDDIDDSASVFGSLTHEIAERYVGGGKEELLSLYHELVPTKYTLTDFYKQKVPIALQNIHEFWKEVLSTNVKKVEHEADITIELNENIKLNGKIDIIIEQNSGRTKIVDYKTNKSNQWSNHTSQLAIYMLLLHKKYGIPYDKMDCEVIYLALEPINKKGETIENVGYKNISKIYTLDECDVDCLISEIETIDKAIQKSIDKGEWKSKPGKFNCTYCPFASLCDKKWTLESEQK